MLGAGIGGWFLYQQISKKISSNAPVAVEYYVNLSQADAEAKITEIGLTPDVKKGPNIDTAPGLVYKQDPTEGNKIPKGNPVTIWVSTGKPKVQVPTLVGQQETDAVNQLKALHLKPDVHGVNSNTPANQVTAQDPKAGTKLVVGSSVRINVSKGPAADSCAERRRHADRPGDCDAAGGRLQLDSDVRRLEQAGEHRHQPEPGRRLDRGEGTRR